MSLKALAIKHLRRKLERQHEGNHEETFSSQKVSTLMSNQMERKTEINENGLIANKKAGNEKSFLKVSCQGNQNKNVKTVRYLKSFQFPGGSRGNFLSKEETRFSVAEVLPSWCSMSCSHLEMLTLPEGEIFGCVQESESPEWREEWRRLSSMKDCPNKM